MKTRCMFGLNLAVLLATFCFTGTRFVEASSFTIDFDHLSTLGPTTGSQSFADANGGSTIVNGVNFMSPFRVIGDQARVAAGGPAFGLPHSGHYFLNNGNTPNDDLVIMTTSVLTESWFGRNEYYGYGGGATSVTVTAFGAGGDLGFETVSLPDTFPYTGNLAPPNDAFGNGLPDPLVRLDTSSFLSLSGIIGYRISRVATGPSNGDWVGDDFTFQTAAVPEPSTLSILGVGLVSLVAYCRRTRT